MQLSSSIQIGIGIGLAVFSIGLLYYWFRTRSSNRLKDLSPEDDDGFDTSTARNKKAGKFTLETIQRQFEIQLTPGQEVRIDNLSGSVSKLVKIHLGIRLGNPAEYPITVQQVRWELWLGPIVKSYSCRPNLRIAAHAEVSDYEIDEVIHEKDFLELAQFEKSEKPVGYVEGLAFCRSDFGNFQKKFVGFNVKYQLRGAVSTLMNEARQDQPTNLDSLTGLLQRKFLDENFQTIIDTVTQRDPVSYILIDVDHFKTFNDNYGHLVGDEILKTVSAEIKKVAGEKGLAVRYGGDEFCIILEAMNTKEAEIMARNVHKAVGNCRLKTPKGDLQITLSVGVGTLHSQADYKELIRLADRALYVSKRSGRNQVTANYGDLPDVEERRAGEDRRAGDRRDEER